MIDISVTNLVKEFEVGSKILDGLTFQVDSGERVGLLGPNGCGKTTLLRILTGVMDYDEGEVVIAPGRRLGLISQIPKFPAGYTVEDAMNLSGVKDVFEITVDSTLGKGSRFTVSVALKFRDAEDGEPPVLTDLPVLVVDDERDVCEYASLLLKEVGMRAFWVLSGQEAVAEIVRAHEERDDYFAVILDWKMPNMDGLDTAREIRRRVGPDLPIIMLSGYDCSDVGADFLAAGVDVFIMKPLFKSNMVHLLRNFAEDRGCGHASAVPRPEGQRLDGLHVLLVEDNEINQEIAKELLLMEGASVDVADNGEQALNIFARSEEGSYQLVLMDIQMPVMDGYTATAALRSLRRDDAKTTIILAMTANVFSDDVIKAEASGMNGHISKPFDPDKLYAMIAASCHKKRGDGPAG
mgnify:CR=1 FL=1